MSDKVVKNLDLQENSTIRTPVVVVIDTSYSMGAIISGAGRDTGQRVERDGKTWMIVEGGRTLIEEVTDAVNNGLYKAIRDHEFASYSCEVAIVTFNDKVEVVEEFTTIDKKAKFLEPEVNGETRMGAGINAALKLAEERKKSYKDAYVPYHQPWLILFTDGDPTDDIGDVQRRVTQLEEDKKLTVYTIALTPDVNLNVLRGFSNRNEPFTLTAETLPKFFEFLGQSVANYAAAMPGDVAPDLNEEWKD